MKKTTFTEKKEQRMGSSTPPSVSQPIALIPGEYESTVPPVQQKNNDRKNVALPRSLGKRAFSTNKLKSNKKNALMTFDSEIT